jgi:hypothetical protein
MNYQDGQTTYLIIIKYFSVFCLLVLLIQVSIEALYIWFKTKSKPELKQGYKRLILGYSLLMGLPFFILSIGTFIQNIPSILYLFMLGDGNFFSWMFFITLLLEYIFLLSWIWLFGGADFLVMHPGLFINQRLSSPLKAKLLITAMVCGGVVGMTMLILFNFAQ